MTGQSGIIIAVSLCWHVLKLTEPFAFGKASGSFHVSLQSAYDSLHSDRLENCPSSVCIVMDSCRTASSISPFNCHMLLTIENVSAAMWPCTWKYAQMIYKYALQNGPGSRKESFSFLFWTRTERDEMTVFIWCEVVQQEAQKQKSLQ